MGTQRVQEKVLFYAAIENVDVLMLQDVVANTSQPIETQKTTPSNKSGTSARRSAKKNTFKPAVTSPGFRLVLEHAFSHRVCIYVRHDLDVSAYELVQHDDMIATFSLLTEVDWLHMHCIYNVTSKSIPTDRFKELMSAPGQHLMMGDFNMKHPWWGDRRVRNKKSRESKALHEAFKYELEICLLTQRGARTREATPGDRNRWSTIDLAFATSILAKRCTTKILNHLYVGSDHYITQVDIEMSPDRVFSERRDYSSANGAQLCNHVKERLKSFEADPLDTIAQLDESVNVLVEILAEVNQTIPVLPSTRACFTSMSPSVQEAFKAVRRRANNPNASQSPAYASEFREIELNANKLWALDKELKWNDHMARSTTNLDGTYKKYRQALRKEKTREPAHMPPVIDPKDPNIKHTNVDAKSDCLAEAILLVPTDQVEQRTVPDLPFDCDPDDLPACDQITLDQIDQLIREIPGVKSIVDGGIPNALLKLCREAIVPYLHRLFNACLKHCYHPARFKHATTCILRKPLGPYNLPKNWRPIALLCSIGKMFESVICKMLTAIAIKHNMIPETQMAFAGRTTGDALLYVETVIRAAWFKRRMVTLLGLDMSKAYDRVNRTRLLQILYEKGVPKGLIVLIRSFLSDRTTTIRMPGKSSKRRYAVNLGIPQGSPLSPLLFLFYTAPLLEKLAEPRNGKGSRFHVAFSDDLTIMEVSESVVDNCMRLSADYKICAQWAKEHNMEFNTKKFDCMHFSMVPSEAKSKRYPLIPGFVPGDQFGVALKFLGVMLDPKLKWGPHMAHVQQTKVAPLRRTFKRLFGPKFGPPMEVGTQLYRSVVFSAVTYALQVWGDFDLLPKVHQQYLETTQNMFLRIISQLYGPTEVLALHKELRMRNILVEIERLRSAALAKTTTRPVFQTICDAHNQVYDKADSDDRVLPDRRRRSRRQVPDPFFARWTRASKLAVSAKQSALEHMQRVQFTPSSANTAHQNTHGHLQRRQQPMLSVKDLMSIKLKQMGNEKADAEMESLWIAKCATRTTAATYMEPWGTDVFAAHKGLSRIEAINLVRLKTEFVRVAAFMFKICSTTYHPGCPCGAPWQTVYHLFARCPHLSAARRRLIEDTGHNDFYRWLTHDGAIAAKWATEYFGLVVTDWMLHYLSALDPDADPGQLPPSDCDIVAQLEKNADSAAKPTQGRKRSHQPPPPTSRHHHIERSRAAQARTTSLLPLSLSSRLTNFAGLRRALQKIPPRTHDAPAAHAPGVSPAHDPSRYLMPISPLTPRDTVERLTDYSAECLTFSRSRLRLAHAKDFMQRLQSAHDTLARSSPSPSPSPSPSRTFECFQADRFVQPKPLSFIDPFDWAIRLYF
ncbi:RVT 1 multi-domain protein [Pyrenophora teres f. teres]|uniref:RVT 1 multi-domain protein n=1 Tax=Pyrenophora teres f. teres TaxID=97479 RepID=A0A6S6W286_9PLEO|nr:RVT 1 multi-domain protein [Pyrenophora teres f. teres]